MWLISSHLSFLDRGSAEWMNGYDSGERRQVAREPHCGPRRWARTCFVPSSPQMMPHSRHSAKLGWLCSSWVTSNSRYILDPDTDEQGELIQSLNHPSPRNVHLFSGYEHTDELMCGLAHSHRPRVTNPFLSQTHARVSDVFVFLQ